jgi:hypothetical protein
MGGAIYMYIGSGALCKGPLCVRCAALRALGRECRPILQWGSAASGGMSHVRGTAVEIRASFPYVSGRWLAWV